MLVYVQNLFIVHEYPKMVEKPHIRDQIVQALFPLFGIGKSLDTRLTITVFHKACPMFADYNFRTQ